jgi:hypothetical protein
MSHLFGERPGMRRSSDASIRGKRTGEVCRGGASCSFRQQSVQASEVSFYLRHSEKGSLPDYGSENWMG